MYKKLALILTLALLSIVVLAGCIPQPVNPYMSVRQISVSGQGKVYVIPDLAYVSVGVQTQADAVADALAENNAQAQQVASVLQELGVAPEDIQTTSFNIYPQQEYGPNGEIVRTYYVVENSVYVTVRNLQGLGDLLDRVVRSGANSIKGVSFDVTNREEKVAEARRLAVQDAQARAQEVAQAAGIELGEIQSINVYSNSVPLPVFEGKGGAVADQAQPPVAAGQLVISAEASASYAIE